MVGITEAKAAYDSIKAAFERTRGVAALKGETEVNAAVLMIQRQLLEAQAAALADREKMADLQAEIGSLTRRLAEANSWKLETDRYRLTQSPLGAFTYDLVPELAAGEAFHRLCATCFTSGKKSILHTQAKHSGGESVRCNTCKEDLMLASFQSTISYSDGGRDRYGY